MRLFFRQKSKALFARIRQAALRLMICTAFASDYQNVDMRRIFSDGVEKRGCSAGKKDDTGTALFPAPFSNTRTQKNLEGYQLFPDRYYLHYP